MIGTQRYSTSSIAQLSASAMFLCCLTACSTVPDWSRRESKEFSITATFDGAGRPRTVRLPSSSPHLLILELDTSPGQLEEQFSMQKRELVLPGDRGPALVRCRYRLFRRHGGDGTPLPWVRPRELFPDADRIQQGFAPPDNDAP